MSKLLEIKKYRADEIHITQDDIDWLIEKVEYYGMKYENTGAIFNRQHMQSKIEEFKKLAIDLGKENNQFRLRNEELLKENEKLKGFIEYLQARNKDMVNINGWHMKTNKHLRERISELDDSQTQK